MTACCIMRIRFTIRDLLWLTLVVALATGWWVDHKLHSPYRGFKEDGIYPFKPPYRATDQSTF
jgi:hypothetical protein